jgi:hypothetical protein
LSQPEMAYVGAVIGMRVESIQLETSHSVYSLREKVSIGCYCYSTWTTRDLPNVIVTVVEITTWTAARTATNVLFVVTPTNHSIHEAIHENVVDNC